MSYTLAQPIEDAIKVGDGTTDADCGGGNPAAPAGYRSPSSLREEPDDLIYGKEARFARAASRRALKKILGRERDDVETR